MSKRHLTYFFSPRTPNELLIRMILILLPAVVLYLTAGLNPRSVGHVSTSRKSNDVLSTHRKSYANINATRKETTTLSLGFFKIYSKTDIAIPLSLTLTNANTQITTSRKVTQTASHGGVQLDDNRTLPATVVLNTAVTPYVPPKNLEFSYDSPIISTFKLQAGKATNASDMSIKSACPFPKLELNDPAIMQFYVKHSKVVCDWEEDWVTLRQGVVRITGTASKKYSNITCDLYPLVKESDFKVVEAEPLKNVKNGTRIFHDFYKVSCLADGGAKYRNWHAGVRQDDLIHKRQARKATNGLNLDVIIFGLDSVSRLAWLRHLPLTRDYFVKVLNGIEMEGYNILGDGTPAALTPLLTGYREDELPEARRGYPGAKPVDDFPWIWKDFKEAGYVTAWGEDTAHLGTFQFRLLGFTNQPTDHYYRDFPLATEPYYYGHFPKFCVGSKPRHTIFLDYFKDLLHVYQDKRKWLFFFHSEMSHQDNNYLTQLDEDILQFFQDIHKGKHLDNAILIMLADHGARFSKVRATAQGKQEERLPYLGIRFPEWFATKFPDIISNVRNNIQKLTTPFDVHETLHEILNFTGTEKANITKRGVSLLKLIPDERNCDWAQIDPHWCACLEWTKVSLDSRIVKKVIRKIVHTFNNYTKPFRKDCAVLKLQNITSAVKMKVKDAVLKFRDTSDGGRGRFGKMDDTTELSQVLYQVVLTTKPGDGVFEVTVTHHLKENKMEVNKKDISRTNKYGNASHCVVNKEPFLRPYCYCKDLIKS
ncbi:uncharacterized protein LOC106052529 isoform X3 [Biomphalaria glabrata]|uniref:Uncharacterized protein LOC106052529 isoform X3 n=1 Tax=Biomphalaria glabrata TaxID=6526 RepID=A0A9W3BBK5_BIOGL|nr:uncharacterized protein LOC106052529 isoform X3 [Biomphalaria glabrata]